jgi:hypothetical protein
MRGAQGSEKLHKALILYEDGTTDTISIMEAEKLRIIPPPPPPPNKVRKNTTINDGKPNEIKTDALPNSPIYTKKKPTDSNYIIIINGKIQDKEKLKGKTIETKGDARVYGPDNKEAIKLCGEAAKNGVMVFTDAVLTDKLPVTKADTVPKFDRIFTKVENEAQFPGGQPAWIKYIQAVIQQNADLLIKDKNQGTCLVEFIVDVNGNVSDVKATTMEKTKLAQVGIQAIKEGPKWKPAIQNGHLVTSYKKQAITFKLIDNKMNFSEPE